MPQIEVNPKKISVQRFTEDLFGRDVDYPHTLAADSKGMLIWKTEEYKKWEDVMKILADTYITVRTSFSADGHDDIDERHLLGFPITNHSADKAHNWGKNARHASPLRFFVRKREDNYYGFILHIPFGISNRMRKNASGQEFFSPAKQFEIWQKVYQRLDKLCARANIHECL
jgi:CRISPR-associated protein Cmr1